jgi:hypothetical protein
MDDLDVATDVATPVTAQGSRRDTTASVVDPAGS